LKCLFTPVIAAANSIAALASAVLATNVATADEYIAIVLPGRMFKAAFEKRRLAPDRFCPGRSVRPELPGRRSSPGTSCDA
jgi:Na+/H+ antiporter NhaC